MKQKVEKRPYHHGNLRQVLIETAATMVAEQGIQHLTMRELAQRALVSHTALYRHFKDKQALLAAVAETGFHLLLARLLHELNQDESAIVRLQQTGVAYVLFAAEYPHYFRVMFSAEMANRHKHPTLQETAAKTFKVMVDLIIQCQQQNVIEATDPLPIALTTWCIVHGLANLWIEEQILFAEEYNKITINEWALEVTNRLREGLRIREVPVSRSSSKV